MTIVTSFAVLVLLTCQGCALSREATLVHFADGGLTLGMGDNALAQPNRWDSSSLSRGALPVADRTAFASSRRPRSTSTVAPGSLLDAGAPEQGNDSDHMCDGPCFGLDLTGPRAPTLVVVFEDSTAQPQVVVSVAASGLYDDVTRCDFETREPR
jgi:hypothetical protein